MPKKRFKLIPGGWNRAILLLLILLPSEVDTVIKEQSSKRYAVKAFSFNGSKVVFTLLRKVIAFNVELITIHVWGPSFLRLFTRFIVSRNLGF